MDLLVIAARVASEETVARIRHKDKSKKFDLAEFKALKTADEMHMYAHGRLDQIGRGTSRAVYALSSSKVLKIAAFATGNVSKGRGTSEPGEAQNRAEVEMFTDPVTKPVVAEIYDFDPSYRWLICQAVRETSDDEFKAAYGAWLEDAVDVAKTADESDLTLNEAMEWAEDQFRVPPKKEAVQMILGLIDQGQQWGDLRKLDHWGKAADGRIVLLDYGFTRDVAQEFYVDEEDEEEGGGLY